MGHVRVRTWERRVEAVGRSGPLADCDSDAASAILHRLAGSPFGFFAIQLSEAPLSILIATRFGPNCLGM